MDKRLKYKSQHQKFLEENIGKKFSDILHSDIFTNRCYRAKEIKGRINKWNYIKLKSFCTAKDISLKWKGNQPYGKTYLPTIPWTRVWSPKYIKNSYNSTPGRQTIQLNSGQKTGNRHFSKEDIQKAHRHMKGCSASPAIREVQIKSSMRYHFTSVRMAIINKSTINKCWQGCGEKGTLVHCWWECSLVQSLQKTVWNFLKKIKVELPFDPEIPLLGLYTKNPETPIQKNLCTPMFIAAQFITAKCWKQTRCPSVNEWIKNCGIFTQWNIMQQKEKRSSFLFLQHGWNWWTLC